MFILLSLWRNDTTRYALESEAIVDFLSCLHTLWNSLLDVLLPQHFLNAGLFHINNIPLLLIKTRKLSFYLVAYLTYHKTWVALQPSYLILHFTYSFIILFSWKTKFRYLNSLVFGQSILFYLTSPSCFIQ